ncbi:hypothetical protein F5Y08DRAFT_320962 [Xylaria arbuscula]|nr:hypothetical protein F5Y08DRAFT_320962 [Xylaria arbuscula]
MARHKVIADSEDEDEGDDVLLIEPEGALERPEPEPLSPQHQAEGHHNHSSDTTDPSFFANIYDDQQGLAVQQSDLVENIVRQSQRACASSGDVSLPALKRRRANPSSGTDVTSPRVSSKPRNHSALFPDDASEITTPRKSTGQEWEIPSSPEDGAASHHTKGLAGRKGPDGEKKRTKLSLVSSPTAAAPIGAETTSEAHIEDDSRENQVEEGLEASAVSTPLARKPPTSYHNSALPDATKFYIAQSSLTTMQKLEYQKVTVSNSYGGLPGSLPHQKSSGVTTIAYSTPSGYSPVPPLPGEEFLAPSPQHLNILNMSSSPNMADSGFELPDQAISVPNIEVEIPAANHRHESPGEPQDQTPVGKRKKRTRQVAEEDELCQDDPWDVENLDAPQSYKPRPTKRRSILARDFMSVENNDYNLRDISDDDMPPTQSPPRPLSIALPDTDPVAPPAEAPPEVPPEIHPEPYAEAPLEAPRKRGRKKKQQPGPEVLTTKADMNEDSPVNQTCASLDKATMIEPSPDKPKKRRGRPRKSELPKAVEESLPEPSIVDELPETDVPQEVHTPEDSSEVTTKRKDGKGKRKEKRNTLEEDEPPDSEGNRPPLREVDNNSRSPSKSVSDRVSPDKASAEPPDRIQTPKAQLKETPTLGASQSKLRYRVGLSKRSRIAPLLKSIRK